MEYDYRGEKTPHEIVGNKQELFFTLVMTNSHLIFPVHYPEAS